MKIMFMGTPDFAVTALNALNKSEHNVAAVITTPDKPRGRGHKMTHTPVYEFALAGGIPVYTLVSLKKDFFEDTLISVNPDVIVVAAYGKLLPEYVINYPRYGCINIHASLLPKYRGAAPIQRAIIDGEKNSGVTTMYMNKGLDTGDILLRESVDILENDNFETLHDKLADVGADLIIKTLTALENGTCQRIKQDDSLSTYASMITKETLKIDWTNKPDDIYNLVRALYPIPKAETSLNGKKIKIGKCKKINLNICGVLPGTIINVTKKSFCVSCASGSALEILMLQPEGKKMMNTEDYLKGNKLEEGTVLGG